MVGREFVPNEDMGEWTVHVDAPEGTSLEGTTEVAFKLLEGAERHRRRGADRAVDRRRRPAGLADAHPLPVSGAADRRAEEHAGADHHRDAPPAGGASRATGRASARATRSAAARAPAASRSRRTSSGPTSSRSPSTRSRRWSRGAEAAQPHRGQDRRSTSRTPRSTSPSIASGPPTSACAWRRSATRCGWRCRATTRSRSTRKGRSSTRSRSACSRASAATSTQIGRLTVPSANGPVRIDNIARLERGLGPTTLQRSDRQFTVS